MCIIYLKETFFPEKFGAENDYSVKVTLQNLISGGNHSAYSTQGNTELSAHSWRKETNYIMVLDVFYDPHHEAEWSTPMWRLDPRNCWRQLSYAIKNQLRHPKPPTRVLYGIRQDSRHM